MPSGEVGAKAGGTVTMRHPVPLAVAPDVVELGERCSGQSRYEGGPGRADIAGEREPLADDGVER